MIGFVKVKAIRLIERTLRASSAFISAFSGACRLCRVDSAGGGDPIPFGQRASAGPDSD
jgi:hypothetical protein